MSSPGTVTPVVEWVHNADLPAVLEPVVRRYRDERAAEEGFGDFVTRARITPLAYTPSGPLCAARERVSA